MVSFGGTPAIPIAVSATATAAYAAGLLGNAIAFVLYLIPMRTFLSIWLSGAVPAQVSVLPEMVALLNAMIWGMAGVPSVQPGNELSLGVNAVGFLCLLFYTVTFFCYGGDRCFPFYIGFSLEIIAVSIIGSLVFSLPDKPEDMAHWANICGCATAILMYCLPAWNVMMILCNFENAQPISVAQVAGALANAVVWVIYSNVHDLKIFVLVPNVTGVVIGVIQLLCYYYCQPNAPADSQEDEP